TSTTISSSDLLVSCGTSCSAGSPISNGPNNWTARNATCECINDAIQNAASGDTINVPAGSATWNSTLNITKGINLIGGNGGKTTITYGSIGGGSEQFLIRYDPLNLALNTPFRLSGFTFNLNSAGPWLGLGENYKKAPFTIQDKIRIDHNTVTN